ISIFVGCIIYFREKISKLTLNPKEGSLELELEEFKEDIVNNLIIKQNLLEIASGRYDGPPKKLKEILNLLGEEAYKKGEKYSSAMPYTEKIVEAYNEIDSIGSLKPAASDYDEKQKEMEQSHEKLETAFDDFLNYLKNKE
ncbi:hypothetical protein KKF29_03395, partial [Patescibacteria group bacterium]|nr:hypothetical protein [Patescibacteria group bacterium]